MNRAPFLIHGGCVWVRNSVASMSLGLEAIFLLHQNLNYPAHCLILSLPFPFLTQENMSILTLKRTL